MAKNFSNKDIIVFLEEIDFLIADGYGSGFPLYLKKGKVIINKFISLFTQTMENSNFEYKQLKVSQLIFLKDFQKLYNGINDYTSEVIDFEDKIISSDPLAQTLNYARQGLDNYVSVESIVSNGEITHITISSKPLLSFPFRESGLVTCCPLSEVAKKQIYEASEKVIKALNFKNGGTHIELKLTKDGPKLLEFNPRLGGPVPYLIQISSDYPIIREVVNSYFGKKILKFPGFYNVGAFFSFQLETKSKSEIIAINKDIPTFNDNYVKEGYIFKNIGDTIDPYGGTSVMLGFAYLIGESISECFKHREKIIKEMGVRAIINEK